MTGQGIRSPFSTLANERGLFRSDVIKAALAHAEGNAVRAADNKAQLAEERRRLAGWYADALARLEAGAAATAV